MPLSADAASAPYPPVKTTGWNLTVCPGTTVHFAVPAGTFAPQSRLVESVTGTAAVPVTASFLAAAASYSLTSDAQGGAAIALDFPNAALGGYNVSVAEPGTAHVSAGAVQVLAASDPRCDPSTDPAADPAAATDPASAAAPLAHTGTSIPTGVVWGAGAAVLLGAAALLVARFRRSSRR